MTIELRAAVERTIVVEYTAAQRLSRVRVQDERGDGVFDTELGGVLPRPCPLRVWLPIGKFQCHVETEGGGKAQVEFEMTSLAESQPPVVVQAK